MGVFCRTCEHYAGEHEGLVICTHPENSDDPDTSSTRHRITSQIRFRALCALDG